MIEQNVRQGSRVYESGHVLVLGWCYSQRDLEVVWKVLEQVRAWHELGEGSGDSLGCGSQHEVRE